MFKWNLREIVVMSTLAVAFAIVYLLFFQVGNVMVGFMGPIGYEPIFGIWFIVSIISAYIIRKPGAAFLSETIAAFIEVLIGNVNGPRLILSGMIQGLGAELVFAATGWKRYSVWVLMAAGMGSSVFSFAWGYFLSGFQALSPQYVLWMFIIRLISGALFAGLLGKYISDALAKTGVLNGMELGKERKRRNAA
ncbi:ECF transporter S component [Lederbergia wuyishanensis]|uniref:Energy-coupling factor transport system substrate-specific component n=1 Tax=Lederbergia wuyishanensis TaxID=1347903 RepID=A0ABU0D5V8_9BACI|nr:ECF transporter S component [Lederbergia wuyishanensis]MCJ8008372.1 ECF transporter S component [Lederbergia wuyishanensis]MDQ0343786.1 energy-coupling factor transport system substrate-specific component [Lederbergia wuyishanensis]